MAQSSEEPPFLTVGTDVSAKYRGAFCEANVKAVKKLVKCKITFTKTNTTVTLNNDCVKGLLKVGATVEAKNPDGQYMEGVVTKLTDASVYTVVFDDGDERTLRRTSLCLKGARHFNESETLDHLPLTDPENFGTPVVQDGKKRKKRRLSQAASMDDSETEREEQENVSGKKKRLFDESIVGKVVVVESGSKRRNMWFPALGVNPSKNEVDLIRTKDNCLVRSFKDGKYHVINVKDAKEFSQHQDPVHSVLKGENRKLKAAVERAVTYLETGRIPAIWEDNSSDVIVRQDGEEDVKKFHGSEDESTGDDSEEKNSFNESLTAFMKENGTPISRAPVLGNQDLDLHKLYKIVQVHGGMEKVSSEGSLWRKIYRQMDIPVIPPSASHHIKMAYKKYLYPFELHQKEKSKLSKKGEDSESDAKSVTSDMSSKADIPESPPDSSDEKNLECLEPLPDIEDDDIVVKKAEPRQSSRGKEIKHENGSEAENDTRLKQVKQDQNHQLDNGVDSDTPGKNVDEDAPVDVVNSPESSSDVSESQDDGKSDTHTDDVSYDVGDKVQVKYGRGRNHRLYDAKIIHIDQEADDGVKYCIHYAGWNNRYDEWIKPEKISGWGTRQTRKRNGSANKTQEIVSKSTPKPMTRPTAKPAGRSNSKAAVSAKDGGTRHSSGTTNNVKAALRPASPSTKSGSASPALGKSPKTSTGRGTARTRSERNSSTDLSNGFDEAIKSPSSRRRQKSTTPEPTMTDQNKLLDVVENPQANISEAKVEEAVNNKKNSEQKNSSEAYVKKEEGVVNSPLSDNGNSNDSPQEDDNDHTSNSKRKEKNKRTVNGLTRTVRSPETVIKDYSIDLADGCSLPKRMKVEKEEDLPDKEVQELLSNENLAKSPNQPQQTQASPTAMETVSCSSALEEEKSNKLEQSSASVSTACSDDSGRGSKPVDSSSSKKEHSEKNHEHSKDNKSEKKNSEHHHRKHKKRREKKKHRHASGNDSTGSDAPGSPLYNNSRGLASPSRPRISFDVDLEEIKAKEDSGERIRLLQDKINEMRKMYSSLKAEVASIDRKRKRLKKKREAAEAQENSKSGSSSSSSLSTSSHTISSPSSTAVECR